MPLYLLILSFATLFADPSNTETAPPIPAAALKAIPTNDPQAAPDFDKFCKVNFASEKEELAYAIFGKEFRFIESGLWLYGSIESACVGFETNLPGRSYVEYGLTAKYGLKTSDIDRFCYLHLHYLSNLKPRQTYHYRLVAIDERGNRIATADKTFHTAPDRYMGHIPDDIHGPPYRLDHPGITYIVTKDLTIDGRAFEIKAKDVTLDLGGHTVTYDNAHQGPPGESGDFPKFIKKSAFGVIVIGNCENYRILNGTIRQGAGNDGSQLNTIGFNPIYLGSQNGEIAGLTLSSTVQELRS